MTDPATGRRRGPASDDVAAITLTVGGYESGTIRACTWQIPAELAAAFQQATTERFGPPLEGVGDVDSLASAPRVIVHLEDT